MNEPLEKLSKRLHHRLSKALKDFDLIADGDRILVCLSGGKDSYTLLTLLQDIQARAPIDFSLVAFHLDQGQPGYPDGLMAEYLDSIEVEHRIVKEDTYSIVKKKLDPSATPCSLCSRLRRGIIYNTAEELGCNTIALGHHRDDSVETLMLNMFHSGQMQGMPAVYTTDDGRFDVIRPMLYIAEEDIEEFARLMEYPIIPCTLCGSIAGRRAMMKQLLDELEGTIPHVRNSILAAMQNVRTTHLLDPNLLERSHDSEPQTRRSHTGACASISPELF